MSTGVWRGKCATDPTILAETIQAQAGSDARVGIETGPPTPWLVHALRRTPPVNAAAWTFERYEGEPG
jgi:hypothetical protein